MLLFDRGNGETGKRYGADLKAGDQLSGVTGRFINYFGVPEISPSEPFKVGQNAEILPEEAGISIDSADVCRFMVLENAVVNSWSSLTYNGKEYAVDNKFRLPAFTKDVPTRTYVIVSYDYNVVTLYIIKQELPSALEDNCVTPHTRVVMQNGVVIVETDHGRYTLQGEKIF
jgi:hypothetical protein